MLIFGAGVIGTACAYELVRAGCQVTMADRGRFAGGCSHGNCGYISPSHVLPHAEPGAIRKTLATLLQRNSPLKVTLGALLRNLGWFRGFARRCNESDMHHAAEGIHAILKASRSLYEEMVQREAMSVEWDASGLLFVFNTPGAFEHYRHVNDLLSERYETPAAPWDTDKLLAEEPSLKPESVSGAFHYAGDVQLRPDLLMREWGHMIEQLGVQIIENCELEGFDGQTAVTTQGAMHADVYVIATGAWTPQLNDALGVKVPIIPGKGYSMTMPRPKLCPRYPMIFEEHRVAISPFQSGYRIGSTMEFAGYDASLNLNRIQLLKDGAAFYLKEPFAEPVQEQWWGWRPMVYDGKPVIDFSPNHPNVLIAAGHGMLGLSMATSTGKLVRELIQGESPHIDPKHYSITRFR